MPEPAADTQPAGATPEEALRLMVAFVRIGSAEERRRLIAVAESLAPAAPTRGVDRAPAVLASDLLKLP